MDHGLNLRVVYEFVETEGVVDVRVSCEFLSYIAVVEADEFGGTGGADEFLFVGEKRVAADADFG